MISGFLLAAALPNEVFLFGSPVLGLICLVPLFLALAECGSPKQAAAAGAVFALVSTPLSNYWLAFFKDFAFLTIGSVTGAYTLLFMVFAGFLWKFSRPGPYRPFLLAAFWTVYEFVKSTGYLAYPWGLVAYPVNDLLPLLQVADIAGIWPISFLMALINALGAEVLLARAAGTVTARTSGAATRSSRVSVARAAGASIPDRGLPAPPARGFGAPPARGFGALPARGFGAYSRTSGRHIAASALFLTLLVLVFLGYGLARMSRPIPEAGRFTAVLVQQNVDPWLSGSREEALLRIQELSRSGVAAAGGADLVVWSESSLFRPYGENRTRFLRQPPGDPFRPFLMDLGAPLLTGNPIVRDGPERKVLNGVILLAPDGEILDDYGKRHPVPMAEHVPFWEFRPVRDFFQKIVGLDSIWDLGERDTIFSLPVSGGRTIRFGAPICFEDAFPYLCRRFVRSGADLLINLTNDAWSRMESAQTQHFVVARFRSIEMKRVLIRSTNAGLTSVIGPFGEIRAALPMFREEVLAAEIPVFREESLTPYTRYGDYFPLGLAAILTLFLVRDKKSRGSRLFDGPAGS